MLIRIEESRWNSLTARLLERRDVETAAIMVAEPVETSSGLVMVVRMAELVPENGYLIRRGDQLRIDPVSINRLVRPARDAGLSVFTVHSHPGSVGAWFSKADDAGDARLLPSFANQVPAVPHGALVVTGAGQVAARALVNGELVPARVQTIGRTLRTVTSRELVPAAERFARQELALGALGQSVLRGLRVGVVGLGGVGSLVAMQLAHIGVGELVFFDADGVEDSNLSRLVGATVDDSGVSKTTVAERYAAAHGHRVLVDAHQRFLATPQDARELAHCDVIMSCVDRHTPRALLNRLAYDALIPVIDMGTAFRVDSSGALVGTAGRVVVVGPGRPCLACWGHIDPQALRREALTDAEREEEIAEGYIEGADVAQPSVMPFNTMVAGAAVIELLRLVTSFAGADTPPLRLGFRFEEGSVRRNSLAGQGRCKRCGGGSQPEDRILDHRVG